MIKAIAHTSDWHLKPYADHNQYLAFEKTLIADLKKRFKTFKKDERLIVIVGDIFDNKQKEPSNEAMLLVINTIKKLTDIAKVVATIGNHDYDINNKQRQDCITPVYESFNLLGNKDFIYLKETCCHPLDNLVLCHYSNYQDNTRPDIEKYKKAHPTETFIGLYHDVLRGCYDFQGKDIVELSQNHKAKKVDIFEGCDFALLGDIHKHQKLEADIPIVYAGSPYQLHYGENVSGHGYCFWNVDEHTFKFIELDNNYAFYNLEITSFEDIDNGKEKITNL